MMGVAKNEELWSGRRAEFESACGMDHSPKTLAACGGGSRSLIGL